MAQLMEGMNPKQENSDEEYEEEDENPKNKKGQKKKGAKDEKKSGNENGIEEHRRACWRRGRGGRSRREGRFG